MNKLLILLLLPLPSTVKIMILKMSGHEIGRFCKIGICYLDIEHISMEDGASISHFNFFKGLKHLHMGSRARIGGRFNWFTASKLHDRGQEGFGTISLGDGCNITSKHFFDLQQKISIGSESLIAGFRSSYWTHGYRDTSKSNESGVEIGSKCYVGSQVIFIQGAKVGDNCFVGAGSVLTKDYSGEKNMLIAGNPARAVKQLDEDIDFFRREQKGFAPSLTKE